MYRIAVEDRFSGAHRLRFYRGSCERLHGHNWVVRVQIEGASLGEDGLLIDFRKVKRKLTVLIKKLDHHYLNSLTFFKKREPTAENIAKFIFDVLQKQLSQKRVWLRSVRVKESEDSWAEYINGSGE